MPGPVLYSTNPYFAVDVARRYRGERFYAWCSEVFSAGQEAGNAPSRMIAASSDPKTIYEQLHLAVCSEDRHDARIRRYKRTFKTLAETWLAKGEISKDQRDEIWASCMQPSFRMWRPLLFVIPREPVQARLMNVSAGKRAGHGSEYTISDLAPTDFDIVDLPSLRDR